MPRLPVNRYGRSGLPVDESIFVVTAEAQNAVRLVSLNRHARRAGLTTGMTLASARAAAPDLVSVREDALRDEAFLKALQRWCVKFTPWSACDGKDALILNITGCAHLFGGEAAMVRMIGRELADLGVESRTGLADTKCAARAAAHFGPARHTILPPGETRAHIAPYPVDALFLERKTLFDLKRLGLKRIGDLYPLKSAELARRFGFGLLRTFEKLIGSASDPVTPVTASPSFAARISFPDPIGLRGDVDEAMARLTEQICTRLTEHAHGARALRLTVMKADKTQTVIDIGLARPTQHARPILDQFGLKLETLKAGTGIDVMRLQAISTEPFRPVQKRFAEARDRDDPDHDDLDMLITTLGNRLGFDRILRWAPVSSHIPARSFRFIEAVHQKTQVPWRANSMRPLIMFAPEPVRALSPGRPPAAFEWRRRTYTAGAIRHHERIAPEWWRTDKADDLRDYWRVDSREGPRLWLSTCAGRKPSGGEPVWEIAGLFP